MPNSSASASDGERLSEEDSRPEGRRSLQFDDQVENPSMNARWKKMALQRASTMKAVQSLQASHAQRAASLCSFLQRCRDDPHLTDDSPILKFLHVVPARDLSSAFDLPTANSSMCIFDILRIFHGHKYVLVRDWGAGDPSSDSNERVSVELVWQRAAFTEVALQSDDLYEPVSNIADMVPEIPTVMISDTLDLVLQTMCLTGSEHVATVNDEGLITGVLSFDKIYESLINEIEALAGLAEDEATVKVDQDAEDDRLVIANVKDRDRTRNRLASDRKAGGIRQTATAWVDSPFTELLILVMLFVDGTASILEITGGIVPPEANLTGIQNPLTAITGAVLIVFVFEATLRLYSLQGSIIWHPLDMIDTVIIAISATIFVLTIVNITDPSLKGLISLGRILRLMRLIKFAKRLRKIVGANKSRYQKNGFDLDLTYITPSCIAMSLPATGAEAHFRNPIDEVQRFFYAMHPGHFLIFNLCAERTYDAAMFGGCVERICVDDHNPPRVDQLISFIQRVSSFLEQDPDNVFAVHCKGGKGRTGVFVCAWLMFSTFCQSADAAMEFFARLRTGRKAKAVQGVTGAGQRRYLKYFDTVLSEGGYRTNRLVLEKIVMRTCPRMDTDGGCDPWFSIEENGIKVFDWASHKGSLENMKAGTSEMVFEGMSLALFGDVRVRFFDRDYMPRRDEAMFYFWFHTGFVTSTPLVLTKPNIDVAWADKRCKIFSDRFQVECYFQRIPTPKDMVGGSDDKDGARILSSAFASHSTSQSNSDKAYLRAASRRTKSIRTTELGPWIPVQGPSFRVQELARKYKGVKPMEKGVIDATEELQYCQLEPLEDLNYCPASGAPVAHRSVKMYGHDGEAAGGTFMHMNLANVARRKVSGNKRRFNEDGFDLDLTYITPRMIAMGFPSSGWEGQYRNDEGMVYRFFQQRHADHYMIVNLCDERSYSLHTFHEAVVRYPFTDHEPPALELLLLCCAHIHSFLQADLDNVVAVHCKAGKGRTGVAIVASLMYAGLYVDAELARKFYDMRRTFNHAGLTIRSQIRYTRYFEEVLRRLVTQPQTVTITQSTAPAIEIHRVRLNTIPHFDLDGGCDPIVRVLVRAEDDHQPIVVFGTDTIGVKHVSPSSKVFDLSLPAVRVAGDFALHLFDRDLLREEKMGTLWLHSLFLHAPLLDEVCGVYRSLSAEECERESLPQNTSSLTFSKAHIDGAAKDLRDAKFDPDFHLEIFFTSPPNLRGCGPNLSQERRSSAQDAAGAMLLERARDKYQRAVLQAPASAAVLSFEEWVVKHWTGSDFGEYGHGMRLNRQGSLVSVQSSGTKASRKKGILTKTMSTRTTASRTTQNGFFSSFASRASREHHSPSGLRTRPESSPIGRYAAASSSTRKLSSHTSNEAAGPRPAVADRASHPRVRTDILPRASSPGIRSESDLWSIDDADNDHAAAAANTSNMNDNMDNANAKDNRNNNNMDNNNNNKGYDMERPKSAAPHEPTRQRGYSSNDDDDDDEDVSQEGRAREGRSRGRHVDATEEDEEEEDGWESGPSSEEDGPHWHKPLKPGPDRGRSGPDLGQRPDRDPRAGTDLGVQSARSYASSVDPWLLGQDTHCTLSLNVSSAHPEPRPDEVFRRALEKDLATALGISISCVSCDKVARSQAGYLEAAIAFFDDSLPHPDPDDSYHHTSPLLRIGAMVEGLVEQACDPQSVLRSQSTSRYVETVQLSDTLTAALFE